MPSQGTNAGSNATKYNQIHGAGFYLQEWLCYIIDPVAISGSLVALLKRLVNLGPWVSQTRRREVAEYFGPFLPNDMAFCRSYLAHL